MEISLSKRAKTLLAADISFGGRRDLTQEEQLDVKEVLKNKSTKIHRLISIYSMGAVKNKQNSHSNKTTSNKTTTNTSTRLMNIKAIEQSYPLYGKIQLQHQGEVNSSSPLELEQAPKMWISEELEQQLKVTVGDKISLGSIDFMITDIIKDDSTTSWNGIGLAPKVYVGRKYLLKTGLISFGSVANYSYQYLLTPAFQDKDSLQAIQKQIELKINDPAIKVYLPENSSQQVGRVLGYLNDYLGLVALVALFLSGIGTAYLFQSFLFLRLKEIGILKSLGLSRKKIMAIYATQVVLLGCFAMIVALVLSQMVLPLLQSVIVSKVGMQMQLHFAWDALLVALIVSILTGLFVCLPMLKKVLDFSTSDILFGQAKQQQNWSFKDGLGFLPLAILFWSLSIWQAHSFYIGSIFVLAIIISMGILLWILPQIIKLASKKQKNGLPLSSPMTFTTGMAYRNLIRNPFATTMSFLALCLGIMLISLIGQLEKSLQTELVDNSSSRPSLFLFDIQEDQFADFMQFAQSNSIPLIAPTPMIRGRITYINDQKYERRKDSNTDRAFETREEQTRTRFRNRGINLTYALKLKPSETLTEGQEFPGRFDASKQKLPYISLEKRYAKRMQVKIGDVITFDILGVEVKAKVYNLRKVKWTSFVPNFFITFQPGVLEDAPKTYLAAVGELANARQYEIQDKIVQQFHNISIINVKELIGKILKTFGMMGIAIKIMALLCLVVGLVVIFAITQHQVRKYAVELTIQKVLGLSRLNQFIIINKTFLFIVLLSAVLGTVVSIVLGNVLSMLFFDGVWSFDHFFVMKLFMGLTILTIFTVSTASAQVLGKRSRSFIS